MSKRLDYMGGMRNVQPTPQGGLRSPAYLTRCGIFDYRQPDGSVIRELRHPSEVFSEASLSTLRGAPLTIGHPGMVTTDNWSAVAVGHVTEDVHVDGTFVSANVVVQDASAVQQVGNQELVELSCGYDCDVIFDTGVWEGQTYDAVQKNIRYNHVGLGPKNWGRAGNEVALRLDSAYTTLDMNCEKCTHDPCNCPTEEVVSSSETVAEVAPTPAEVSTPEEVVHDGKNSLELEITALKAEIVQLQNTLDSRLETRLALIESAKDVLGGDFTHKGKTDSQIMLEVILSADKDFKADGKSDEYLHGRFDSVLFIKSTENKELASLRVDSLTRAPKIDAAEKARLDMIERNKNAWKTPVGK